MAELWALLISAQENPSGIPDSLLDMKREELMKKKVELLVDLSVSLRILTFLYSRKKKKKTAKTGTGSEKKNEKGKSQKRKRNTGTGTGTGLGLEDSQDRDRDPGGAPTKGPAGTATEARIKDQGVVQDQGSNSMTPGTMVTQAQMNVRTMAGKSL